MIILNCSDRNMSAASVAQSDACPTGDDEIAGSIPAGSGNIFLVENRP